ncbi:catalase [Burkholderia cenocepacia]|nr:catalase [Burkholderia cenocepacia]
MPSVMFDAVFVCGGDGDGRDLAHSADARHFVREAFKHLKPIAAVGSGRQLLSAAHLPDPAEGVCVGQPVDLDKVLNTLSDHLGQHRVWAREQQAAELPA